MPGFSLLPEQASQFAGEHDDLFYVMILLTIFFTTLVLSLLVIFVVRYRRGSKYDRSRPLTHHIGLELAWSIGPLLLGLGVFFWSAKPFAELYGQAPANATEIFVIGKQWMWHLQHANGVRENDELHIPVGRPVKLTMISQDVIHDFFIPAFRVKRDVLPGRYSSMWFTPTKVGKYHFFCAQYCGTQHSEMTGWVYVMEPAAYQQWLASGGPRTTNPTHQTMEAAGEELFNRFACVSCHGFAPARAPSLIGLYNQTVRLTDGTTVRADESYLRESILQPDAKVVEGYQPIMPPFKGQLSEEEVLQLIAFIKSLSKANTGSIGSGAQGTTPAPSTSGPFTTNGAQSGGGAAGGRTPNGRTPAAATRGMGTTQTSSPNGTAGGTGQPNR